MAEKSRRERLRSFALVSLQRRRCQRQRMAGGNKVYLAGVAALAFAAEHLKRPAGGELAGGVGGEEPHPWQAKCAAFVVRVVKGASAW